ncbi:hypothetical protein BRADI_4g27081v3 [Brachypodium distachyon]|uniref:Uncharacterized protein n=1 Tax=Brachypodium distachyon TaxID=15368 RepID=A0A2K2CQH3_BRADI|nr:hypothetical protein BRADI_4g27081v3 [Brachypodium distachyon]PNT64283.1 hypothetical protein BRADI_4g27081v3 [Brachypodium distachyon]PNT64284.1 hypothetical protein BRADI_4g27081v3 [Brachypodium distachyon]
MPRYSHGIGMPAICAEAAALCVSVCPEAAALCVPLLGPPLPFMAGGALDVAAGGRSFSLGFFAAASPASVQRGAAYLFGAMIFLGAVVVSARHFEVVSATRVEEKGNQRAVQHPGRSPPHASAPPRRLLLEPTPPPPPSTGAAPFLSLSRGLPLAFLLLSQRGRCIRDQRFRGAGHGSRVIGGGDNSMSWCATRASSRRRSAASTPLLVLKQLVHLHPHHPTQPFRAGDAVARSLTWAASSADSKAADGAAASRSEGARREERGLDEGPEEHEVLHSICEGGEGTGCVRGGRPAACCTYVYGLDWKRTAAVRSLLLTACAMQLVGSTAWSQ